MQSSCRSLAAAPRPDHRAAPGVSVALPIGSAWTSGRLRRLGVPQLAQRQQKRAPARADARRRVRPGQRAAPPPEAEPPEPEPLAPAPLPPGLTADGLPALFDSRLFFVEPLLGAVLEPYIDEHAPREARVRRMASVLIMVDCEKAASTPAVWRQRVLRSYY